MVSSDIECKQCHEMKLEEGVGIGRVAVNGGYGKEGGGSITSWDWTASIDAAPSIRSLTSAAWHDRSRVSAARYLAARHRSRSRRRSPARSRRPRHRHPRREPSRTTAILLLRRGRRRSVGRRGRAGGQRSASLDVGIPVAEKANARWSRLECAREAGRASER
ncbi:hypothetical protein C4D60_Mb03t05860 [Musa balbisiana]|uniref:Uncharacterized protein n=1 Tax=Musa balbisiana TaxID=52838 RepID=A0A4S8J7V7_MUSBA|nr:hypothetical protein C4D60_Mb03t05860 [Musa balbisiana]